MIAMTNHYSSQAEDYRRIEQAIYYLDANYDRQPSLKEAAESVHLSEYHFQRLFTRWVGISPKRFLQYLTKEHARLLLNLFQGQETDFRGIFLVSGQFRCGVDVPGHADAAFRHGPRK